jgi:alkanesulfonate monooxygenase SsuD/methylene tetrahydromethanopterin reductase-like flavin-dependent oxidoreductase (luciferase family)
VLTFHHPVFMAEETAMLDVLSHGRLDFGVGRGQVVYEYNNFEVEYDSRTQRFHEIVDIILGLWRKPGFTYHGQYYSVDDLTIAPMPVQQPHPPMYLAVSRTPASVQVAVSRQLPILTSANTPDEDVRVSVPSTSRSARPSGGGPQRKDEARGRDAIHGAVRA